MTSKRTQGTSINKEVLSRKLVKGEASAPPDRCPIVENLMTKLCNRFPDQTTINGVRYYKNVLVHKAYNEIRKLYTYCASLRDRCDFVMYNVNEEHLRLW